MAVVPIATYFSTLKYFVKGQSSHLRRVPLSEPSLGRDGSPAGRCVQKRTDADEEGSTTTSAICAIVAANIILVGYVVVAFREDAAAQPSAVKEKMAEKKER